MTLHESDMVEFKESFDREIVITAGSFVNTRGGTIFIGISDRGNIIGTLIGIESLKERVNTTSESTEPRLIPEIEEISSEVKPIVAISIKKKPPKTGISQGQVLPARWRQQPDDAAPRAEMHLQSIGSSWDLTPAPKNPLREI